jgi:hypothetical protein
MTTGKAKDAGKSEAQESDRALSGALIGGAFGLVSLAIFASASYADKVAASALWWGNVFATGAVLCLMASIIFGGIGWTAKVKVGAGNPFDRQAKLGMIGTVLLCTAAAVFAFNPKPDKKDPEFERLTQRVDRLEKQINGFEMRRGTKQPHEQLDSKAASAKPGPEGVTSKP